MSGGWHGLSQTLRLISFLITHSRLMSGPLALLGVCLPMRGIEKKRLFVSGWFWFGRLECPRNNVRRSLCVCAVFVASVMFCAWIYTCDCCGCDGVLGSCWFRHVDDLSGSAHKQPLNVSDVAEARVQTFRLLLRAAGPLCLLSLHPLPTRPEVGNQTNYGCI